MRSRSLRCGRLRVLVTAMAIGTATVALAPPANAAPVDLVLVSTSDAGASGDNYSFEAAVSADGSTVAFTSLATNLDPNDTDGNFDIYVKDLASGNITLASTSAAGVKSNGFSFSPSLSDDGTRVAFYSGGSNLYPGDTNNGADVFVKDLVTGDIFLASSSEQGVPANTGAALPSLSADGNKVAFQSAATNLDPPGGGNANHIYVKNLVTGDIMEASTSDTGVSTYGVNASMSADGNKVAFLSTAILDPADNDTFLDIYLKDLVSGDAVLVTTTDTASYEDKVGAPALSGDGNSVAYVFDECFQDPPDPDYITEIFVRNLAAGTKTLVSSSDVGNCGDQDSESSIPSISADGSVVAFQSQAVNLDPNDTDTNFDVYLKDVISGELILASTSDAGVKGNGYSMAPSISASGGTVAFSSSSNNLDPADADGDIDDVYAKAPVLPASFSVNDVTVLEGDAGTTEAVFTVTRSGATDGLSTVKYRTNGGNATAGADYTSLPLTTLTFEAGQTTKSVTVNIVGDGLFEVNERFNLLLSAVTGAVISDAVGTATIVNDDATTYLAVADVQVLEGNAGMTPAAFTVTRSGNTAVASTVKYATSGGTAAVGTDYVGVALNTLSFAAGETVKTVSVDVSGDVLAEKDETFNLVLSAPTGAVISDAAGRATIGNDDRSAALSVADVSVAEGNTGTTPATFTVTRSGETSTAVTVQYRTNGGNATAGTDYTGVPLTTLSFAGGETVKAVTVDVTGDTTAEANERFNLVLSAAVGAVLADASGTATIVDNEGPITPGPATFLSVEDMLVIEGNTGATDVTFAVTRSGNTSSASTVKYVTSGGNATNGSDYAGVPLSTLSFAAGETSKQVTIAVVGDTVAESTETFNLVLSAPTGAVLSDTAATATIINDDPSAGLSISDVLVIETNAGTTTATFTVTRSGNTTGAATVQYASGGGTATAGADYTALPSTVLSFAVGETTKTVTVNVTGDTAVEPNEKFNLALSAPTGAVISDSTGTATIINDD